MKNNISVQVGVFVMKIQDSRRRTLQTASVSYFVKFHAVTKYVGDVVVKFKGGTLLENGEIHRQENTINSIMMEMILLKLQRLSKKNSVYSSLTFQEETVA